MIKTLILPGVRINGIAMSGQLHAGRAPSGMRQLSAVACARRLGPGQTPALVARWSMNVSTGRLERRWTRERQVAPEVDASCGPLLRLAA